MKKYIISQDQFEELAALAFAYESPALQQLTYEIKPVASMTDDEIKQTVVQLSDELFGEGHDDVGWTDSDTLFYGAFASAIEHHIFGETP